MKSVTLIQCLAPLASLVLLSTSCTKTETPPFNTRQIILDIKEQSGIALSTTNTKVLKVGDGESRDPGYCEWIVFVQSPEKISLPRRLTRDMNDGKIDKVSVKILEAELGIHIADPITTAYEVWETSAGQCHGTLIQTSDGEYLYLQRFSDTSTMPAKRSMAGSNNGAQ